MAFPDAWMNELLSKSDIVTVVSSYMELKPKGRRLWGLCPLHGEKTPSFSVSQDKQLFYCFGCHAGGNVIQFIMEMEHLPFREAVQLLASRAGMEMPENVDDVAMQRERAYKERLYEALKLSARFYMENLLGPEGGAGREYLASRELSSEAVKRFGIGYAPDAWDALKVFLFRQGFTQQELLDAGLLVHNRDKNSVYDAYRNRIIFPIIGTNGRVLGFGARVLNSEDKPKYINTGDTPLYNKRNNLYGLYLHKGKTPDDMLIVEGYMDVIGLFEAGVTNAVASLGTALTVQQARLIKRYTTRVFIAYDGDAAGQNAMLRGLDILVAEGIDVRVIVFPDGLDPDEFVRQRGRGAFDQLKRSALTLNAFKLEVLSRGFRLDNVDDRERFAMKACAFVGSMQPVERDRYYEWIAQKTGYAMEALRAQGASGARLPSEETGARSFSSRRGGRSAKLPQEDERIRAEGAILRAMLESREAAMLAASLEADTLLSREVYRQFYTGIIAAYAAEQKPNCATIMAPFSAEASAEIAAALRSDESLSDPARVVTDCVGTIRRIELQERVAGLTARLAEGSLPQKERNQLMFEIQTLTRQLKR